MKRYCHFGFSGEFQEVSVLLTKRAVETIIQKKKINIMNFINIDGFFKKMINVPEQIHKHLYHLH